MAFTESISSIVESELADIESIVSGYLESSTTNIASALKGLQDPSKLISIMRKTYLPLGGSVFQAALVNFVGPGDNDDWRVRLSIPFDFFMGSAVFDPLVQAGGLIFPYTPTITIGSNASYDTQSITHQNFQFSSYQNSSISEITINADFYVEDSEQAKYWIAVVHFLRAASKMYTSDTSSGGSPPPILSLNGYGDFVFKNVPVVLKSFATTLPNDCDYIRTEPASGVSFNSIVQGINVFQNKDLTAAPVHTLLSNNKSYVPTKSTISVTLLPMYSREAARQFSLETFVNGGYMTGGFI